MSGLQLVILICIGLTPLCSAVAQHQKSEAEAECSRILDNDLGFIAGFVRLAFHDCVNGCDGCVDLNNAENNGLERYIAPLNDSYYNDNNNISSSMSRADFWMTCAAVAVARGHQEAGGNDAAPVVMVKYGRQTCASVPTNREFPNAHHNCPHVFEYFSDTNGYGLTELETVALMGAHTLGEARIRNSGFMGPWVTDKNSLNNDYYVELIRPWNQIENQEGNYQWVRPGRGPPNLMLNTDICLDVKISADISGENNVKDTRNLNKSSTAAHVKRFADNNAHWLQQFGLVFTKMISKTANGEVLQDVNDAAAKTTGAATTTSGSVKNTKSGSVETTKSGSVETTKSGSVETTKSTSNDKESTTSSSTQFISTYSLLLTAVSTQTVVYNDLYNMIRP